MCVFFGTPENERLEPENILPSKGEASKKKKKKQFLGSMLVFGGVSSLSLLLYIFISRCVTSD